ncbi:hypothetical protein IW262DRAFT_1334340 [Armillaria fumosa]|nr:hypothetical protein IW262DRAFT_1334340 [Armillaria fumosa]
MVTRCFAFLSLIMFPLSSAIHITQGFFSTNHSLSLCPINVQRHLCRWSRTIHAHISKIVEGSVDSYYVMRLDGLHRWLQMCVKIRFYASGGASWLGRLCLRIVYTQGNRRLEYVYSC